MRIEPRPHRHWPGITVALLAGLHKAILTSTPVNDDYQHLAYGRQMLGGDLPLRDFWDLSTTLQAATSAAAQVLFGHRLLAEAIVVGVATAIAVYLVFRVLQQVTGSTVLASVIAALFIVATPRVYAYPKWIVYATAAWMWWQYVWWPSTTKAVAAGVIAAEAFYWRHDHGLLVSIGVALGMLAAHGFSPLTIRRTALAGVVAFALTLPYVVFAAVELGLGNLARMELTALDDEQGRSRAELRWPLRDAHSVFRTEPQEAYAPEMTVRWRENASPDDRSAALAKYGLVAVAADGAHAQRVRLSDHSMGSLRDMIEDPLIEDTAGIERGPAAFSWSQWPLWDRVRFRVAPLRFSVLPGLDQQIAAGAVAATILHAVPLLALLLAGPSLGRLLPPAVTPRSLLLFAAFAAIVNVGLLREPYESRVADAIVLPAILFGIVLTALLRPGHGAVVKWSLRAAAIALMLLTVKSFAVAGDFGDRAAWLIGEGKSVARARGAWSEVAERLRASPPSSFWTGDSGPLTMRLAKYVRRCTAPADRILILWYAPEIHHDADRLMAGRHLYNFVAFGAIEDEQRRELDKVMRSAPALILTNRDNYDAAVKTFPAVVRYVESDYRVATSLVDDGDRFNILVRKDSPPPATDTFTGWPCFRAVK